MPRWDCWCGAKGVAGAFCPWCGRRNPGTPPPDLPPVFESAPERNPYELPPPAPMAGPEDMDTHGGEPEGPRVGLTPVTRALGAVLTALLVLGAVTVERRSPDPAPATVAAEQTPSPSPSPSPSETEDEDDFDPDEDDDEPSQPAPPPASSLNAAIASATAFVERTRGRPFKEPVDVRLLPPEQFRRELLAGSDDEEDDGFAETLKALRLADPDEDVEEETDDLVGDSVVGFYDDDRDRLVVRGGRVDWYVHMVLVHELVHAWQDQHFDLNALWEESDTLDEALAVRSLLEGDAQWVESRWVDAQPPGVEDEIERAEDEGEGDDEEDSRARESLELFFSFPYALGEPFVSRLHDSGGIAAIDRAYANPPRSTLEIFRPSTYQAGLETENPPDPRAGGRVVDRGALGFVGLLIYLAENDAESAAFGILQQWRGDEYVTWRSGRDLCTTVSVVLGDAGDRDDLVEQLRKARARSVAKQGDAGVVFTACAEAGA